MPRLHSAKPQSGRALAKPVCESPWLFKPQTNTDMPRLHSAKPKPGRALAKPVRESPWLFSKPQTTADARRLRLRLSQLGRALAKPVRESPWLFEPQTSAKAHPQVQRDMNLWVKGVFFNNLSYFTPLTRHFAADLLYCPP